MLLFDLYGIKKIDYLSVDTEGSELQVLQGINFNKVKIEVIEVEVNYPHDEEKITEFLKNKGYTKKAKLGRGSAIFLHLTEDYKATNGCIAIKKKDFLILLKLINNRTKIELA